MATEIRINHQKNEDDTVSHGYTLVRDGVAEPASPFKYKTAADAEAAGLKEANNGGTDDEAPAKPAKATAKKSTAKK